MLPKGQFSIYTKEAYPPQFASFTIATPIPIPPGGIEVPANTNIETILQAHRRKMMRRAANRRSAQLSRARKKVSSCYIDVTYTYPTDNI